MRFSWLFLAGDTALIVPPTGAKGLNLAASDFHHLSEGLREFYAERMLAMTLIRTKPCCAMTSMLHRLPGADAFSSRIQTAGLGYQVSYEVAMTSMSEIMWDFPSESGIL